jgi:hypothetical protein
MKNGEFKVESGIPIPERRAASKGYSSALRKLKVKQSILFPEADYMSINTTAARVLGTGKYAMRRIGEGVRVWRTA